MLARLQQFITIFFLAAAGVWLGAWWTTSTLVAVTGALLLSLGFSLFLALEFVLLRVVNRRDPAPLPQAGQLVRAWWGETLCALQVFCWRQPFFSRAVPDFVPAESARGRRGVVFVHGFFCNRGFWTPWLRRLQADGRAFAAVDLEPVFASIDDYAPIIDEAVRKVTDASGLPPVLVCHSMGGLAARAWLRTFDAQHRVHHVITIGTPHHGTWLARFSRASNGRQMSLGDRWHRELAGSEPVSRGPLFTCWYSNCDNIVFPPSTATLAGADNRLVEGAAHVEMAFHDGVVAASLARIRDV